DSGGRPLPIDRRRGPIPQCLVQALLVVEAEVLAQALNRYRDRFVALEVHLLVLHRAPQPLHEHVVEGPAATVHADADLRVEQAAGELLARELAALVRVEDSWVRLSQCALQGRDTE